MSSLGARARGVAPPIVDEDGGKSDDGGRADGGADASTAPGDGGGCGCRTARRDARPTHLGLLGGLFLLAARRRAASHRRPSGALMGERA
jgi:hypothetical protein